MRIDKPSTTSMKKYRKRKKYYKSSNEYQNDRVVDEHSLGPITREVHPEEKSQKKDKE